MRQLLVEAAAEEARRQLQPELSAQSEEALARMRSAAESKKRRLSGGRPRNVGSQKRVRRRERPLAFRVRISRQMLAERPAFASDRDFVAAMSKKLGLARKTVQKLWADHDSTEALVKQRRLSLNPDKHSGSKGT